MKRILTVGVFDLFHFGHLKLFENVKKFGGYLIVAVQDTEHILKYKPKSNVLYSTHDRVEMLRAIRLIDEVVTYTDVDLIVKQVDFDVFAKGPDQVHEGFQKAVEYCLSKGKEVVEIPRTMGISSTYLKTIIEDVK